MPTARSWKFRPPTSPQRSSRRPWKKRQLMMAREPDVELGALFFGASEFALPGVSRSPSFQRSKDALYDALIAAGARGENLLDLFDKQYDIRGFMEEARRFLKKQRSVSDLIIYYCGHGGLTGGGEFYLAMRETREPDELTTGLTPKVLRNSLRNEFAPIRVYLILDCCYSASAARSFLSVDPVPKIIENTVFDTFPAVGTSLLSASQADNHARFYDDEDLTVFTDAFVRVL